MEESCKFPGICISGKKCENIGKKIHCCWHEDKSRNKNIIYIDGYGKINAQKHGFEVPIDIFYCPSCKISSVNPTVLIEQIKKYLSELPTTNVKSGRWNFVNEYPKMKRRF